MGYTRYKLFWAWDFEKEEKWLNNMSERGLQLVDVGFCKYVFEESVSCKYLYRIALLEHLPAQPEADSYIRFLEETGVEHIGSAMNWVYLRRKSKKGEFNLFSDIDSSIKHLKLIVTLLLCLLPIEICFLGLNISNAIMGSTYILVYLCLLLLTTVIISSGIMKLCKKIRRLKKERILHE